MLQEKYIAGDDGAQSFYGNNWKAQTFTTLSDYSIYFIKLKLYKIGSPGIITVSIRATDGNGRPTGTDIDGVTGTISDSKLTTDSAGAWEIITFSAPINLDNATKYAIVIRATSGSGGNSAYCKSDNSSPTYTDGNVCSSSSGGGSWFDIIASDLMFECHGSSATLYENYVGPGDTVTGPWNNIAYAYGQTFKPSIAHTLTEVQTLMYLEAQNASFYNDIVCEIWSTSGSPLRPDTKLATSASKDLNGADLLTTDTDGEWVSWDFSGDPIDLDADTTYAIVINCIDTDFHASYELKWKTNSSSVYADGTAQVSTTRPSPYTWVSTDDAKDRTFREFGEEAEVLVDLAGTSAGVSTAAGQLGVNKKIAGTAAAVSTASAILSRAKLLAGISAALSAASAQLSISKNLSGTAGAKLSASAQLAIIKKLLGSAAIQSIVLGNLTVISAMPINHVRLDSLITTEIDKDSAITTKINFDSYLESLLTTSIELDSKIYI
jgi:hypothetical protein